MNAHVDNPPQPHIRQNVACTLCGCLCDDLDVSVQQGRIVAVSPGCPIAEPWFLRQTGGAEATAAQLRGVGVDYARAVAEAANILRQSRSSLIYGLSRSSTPGQRSAIRLADLLGATIDTTASTCHAPSIMAVQAVGESTASLGEIKNRSDLVVYWGSDPMVSHPRHLDRFVFAPGEFIPEGRPGRHVITVDVTRTATSEQSDALVRVRPGGDFELIWALRSTLRQIDIPAGCYGGVDLGTIADLAHRMKSCRYGSVFFGLGLTRHGVPHANVNALLQLVTELNAHTRFVIRRMRVPGDVAGADSVLSWQTGYPFSVNFARGYPRYSPGEYTANQLLERREVDAVLFVGSEGIAKLTSAARRTLQQLPSIVLDYPTADQPIQADVLFTTAVYGLHRPGTAYRMDEVPIPLRHVLDSHLPADHEVLDDIRRAVARV